MARIISIDLPWSEGKENRTVAATLDGDRAGIVTGLPSSPQELAESVARIAAPSALVLLDIPIEGCERLTPVDAFRALDSGLQKVGIPILPSIKSGSRGARLQDRLRARRDDLRVEESYPYAVLRVLWALKRQDKLGALLDGDRQHVALAHEWWSWPPKYKRAKIAQARCEAMAQVAELLKELLGGRFRNLVRSPEMSGGGELERICDEYDAVLGLAAGWALDRASSWSWRAEAAGEPGSIITIGDEWLRSQFSRVVNRR